MLWHTTLESAEFASEGIFIVGVGVVYSDIADLGVDCTGASFSGEVIFQGSFVGECSCLESDIVGDHVTEEEGAMWSMYALDD